MTEANVEAGLRQLSACLRQIESTLAWADLVDAETRPHTPPSFRIDHHIEEDLRNQSGVFIKTAFDLHDILNRKDPKYGAEEDQARWRRQVLRLEERFQRLKVTDRFIKP